MNKEQIKLIKDVIIQLNKINDDNDEKLQKLKEKISLLVGRLINNRDDMRIGITISEIFDLVNSMSYGCLVAEKACALTFLKQFDEEVSENGQEKTIGVECETN